MIPAVRLCFGCRKLGKKCEKLLNWKMCDIVCLMNTMHQLFVCVCVRGVLQLMHIVVLSLLPNLCLEIWIHTHPEVASAFLIHASVVCSQMNLKAVFPIDDVTTLQIFSSRLCRCVATLVEHCVRNGRLDCRKESGFKIPVQNRKHLTFVGLTGCRRSLTANVSLQAVKLLHLIPIKCQIGFHIWNFNLQNDSAQRAGEYNNFVQWNTLFWSFCMRKWQRYCKFSHWWQKKNQNPGLKVKRNITKDTGWKPPAVDTYLCGVRICKCITKWRKMHKTAVGDERGATVMSCCQNRVALL